MGPAPQRSPREPAKGLVVSSGPVALDIRPLSDYQRELIATVLSLRSRDWTDRQIANHFNETGYLTSGLQVAAPECFLDAEEVSD